MEEPEGSTRQQKLNHLHAVLDVFLKRQITPRNAWNVHGEMARRETIKEFRKQIRDRDPAIKHTLAFIDRVSRGWGKDQDVGELARATTNETPEEERGDTIRRVARKLSGFWNPRSKKERVPVRRAFDAALSKGFDPEGSKVAALEYGFLQASAEANEFLKSIASVKLCSFSCFAITNGFAFSWSSQLSQKSLGPNICLAVEFA